MEVMYLGYRAVSMTDKGTGELIEGQSIFYAYPDVNVVGQASGKFFIRKGSQIALPNVEPGDSMNLEFNQYGKVCNCWQA